MSALLGKFENKSRGMNRPRPQLTEAEVKLLERLKDPSDGDGWFEFYRVYSPAVRDQAIRAGLSHAEAEDVVQETALAVRRKLPEFILKPEAGSFTAWLGRLAGWRIKDELRRRKRLWGEGTNELSPDAPDDDSTELERLWRREDRQWLVKEAFKRVRKQTQAQQWRIFRLFFWRGWNVARICRALRIRAGQVYKAKHRVLRLLKEEVEQLRRRE
jgi:RNA polymerase sigma-70 factor (ECF subfamily)